MKRTRILSGLLIVIIIIIVTNCKSISYDNIPEFGREPAIEPDYSGVTIPYNIAPLNFKISEEGKVYIVRAGNSLGMQISIKSKDGIVRFPLRSWKRMISDSKGGTIQIEIISKDKEGAIKKYKPVLMNVAKERIDPYLCYRLLYPGYESWSAMKIVQRSTESFRESSLIENNLLEGNCINCHTFYKNKPDRFLLHVRGSKAGTYFVDGDKVERRELRTPGMPANAVYPSWHPSGKYVAFSSNKIIQSVHMRSEKDNEFYDVFSSLVIYDIEKNVMSSVPADDSIKYMETYPCWSPDGNSLYYCRTEQVEAGFDYRQVKYDLVRKSFDLRTQTFGKAEIVVDAHAIDKSVSLPAISPDGLYLIFTLHNCGSFPIWHKESDLYLLDLRNGKYGQMSLNSTESESWHCWSSNGKWLVFSSKRGDGLTSRPYFAYIGSADSIGKPFVLPQRDPTIYDTMENTFNRPEFVTGRIKAGPRDFARASKKQAIKALWN